MRAKYLVNNLKKKDKTKGIQFVADNIDDFNLDEDYPCDPQEDELT